LGDFLPNQPGSVRAMDTVERASEIERAHTERIARMAAGHIGRELRVLTAHFWRRRPVWIDALLAHIADAGPAGLILRNGNRIADGLALLLDEVEAAIAEAYDDRARRIIAGEAHGLPPGRAARASEKLIEYGLRLDGRRT